ncbi:hypothetical protein O3M35_009680 [Rhynocoris fuscipes]|uniref:Trans-Golgi network integral membrane protein 2 n=1 Tax=Rhynocoris fuscipes TaxID=488301 RepID=A0AAW1D544_9HEMI
MCSYLIFLTIFVLNMDDYLALSEQNIILENHSIKKIALQDRLDCKIEQNDQILHNAHLFDYCADRTLPIVDTDIFKNKDYILCVGYYEALYGICEFNVSTIQMVEIEDAKNKNVCNISHNLFDKMNITHKNIKMQEWFNYVKETMSNATICQSICVFLGKVDPKCTMIINLFSYYKEQLLKNVTSKPPIPNNVKELAGIVQNADKVLPISSIHQDFTNEKQPSPIEESIASQAPVDVKTESGTKQSNAESITSPAQNSELPIELNNKASEIVPDKSSIKADENPVPNDLTNKSLQPQDQPPEDIKDNEQMDGFDKEFEPPSGGKELLAENSFDNNKMLDNKIGGNGDDAKIPNQLNPSAMLNDGDIMSGEYVHDHFKDAEDSNFFVYFLFMTGGCIVAYVLFHNRNKLVALALEGRKGRSARARGGGRHSSASYSKLHSNLEEAIASNTTPPSATNVLY